MFGYGKLPVVLLAELAAGRSDSTNCRIASYLLAHVQEAEDLGVEQLAAACYVSKSSISRFCREIGLEDFTELRDLLRHLINSFSLRIVKTTPNFALMVILQPLEERESKPLEKSKGFWALKSNLK